MGLIKFDLISKGGNDLYLTSAVIMNFLETLNNLDLININSAFHSEGFLHVNLE